MSDQDVSAQLYNACVERLGELAELAGEWGCWHPAEGEHADAAFRFGYEMCMWMIMADGDLGLDEHEFLNAMMGGWEPYTDRADIAEIVDSRVGPTFGYTVPVFFDGIVRMDVKRRTRYSLRAIQLVHVMGLAVGTADDDFSEEEAHRHTTLLETLSGGVIRAGIADATEVAKVICNAVDIADLLSDDPASQARPAHLATSSSAPGEGHESGTNTGHGGPQTSLGELMTELETLVGLGPVKHEVVTMTNHIRVRQMRIEKGLHVPPLSGHLVFYGNPGTGKTTVARILAGIYRELGILSKGHLVETDRSGLVAAYVGQTALKVQEVIQKALGGVLFIDEAYALVAGRHENDYGREAIDTLLKAMEDHREDLIVIVAGYEDKMAAFLASNPGLKSRFNKYVRFADYSPDELVEIFRRLVKKSEYALTPEAESKTATILRNAYESRTTDFGNARLVRNLFEQAVALHSNRVVQHQNPSLELLSLVVEEDIPANAILH